MHLQFKDGSALRISPHDLVLDNVGTPRDTNMAVAFANAFAQAEGWEFLPGNARWPFKPWLPDAPLALPEGLVRKRILQRLGRPRFITIDNSPERKRLAVNALRKHYDEVFAKSVEPDRMDTAPVVVVLTADCIHNFSQDTGGLVQRLQAIANQYRGVSVMLADDPDRLPPIWKLQTVIKHLEKGLKRAATAPSNPGAQANDPEAPEPDLGPGPA